MSWRTLITCPNAVEANICKAKLSDHNIEALILDNNVNSLGYYSVVVPVRVQVQEEDFIVAKRLVVDRGEDGNLLPLEELEALALSHPHPNDVHAEKCPSCGGSDISIYEDPGRGWIGRLVGKRIRKCACGYEWK